MHHPLSSIEGTIKEFQGFEANFFVDIDMCNCKGKSPEVPFHGITSSYNYFEEIWIFAPIQQEAKHDQEKLSAEQK